MRQLPKEKISECCDRIVKNGCRPQYLALLMCITNVGDKNITENQYEIVKNLTAPNRIGVVMRFLCPYGSNEYIRKVAIMSQFAGATTDLDIDELDSELAYHIVLMKVLAACTVGRLNITTIEAKVQSIFPVQDILHALLDPETILVARMNMSLYFFNAIIEVEMRVSGLER